MTKEAAAEIVSRHLVGHRIDDVTFAVDAIHVQVGDNWLRVPVRPSHWPERRYAVYEELGKIEEEIANSEGVQLFLFLGEPVNETAVANALPTVS